MKNQKLKRLLKSALAVAVAVTTLAQPVFAANWVHNNTGWWWCENNGSYPANQWKSIGGTWYWFDSNGYMATGWRKINGTWYWMDASGAMATGWRNINGTWYYLESSGAMASNKWIGNYYVEASGAMATNKWIGNYYVNGSGLWTQTRTTGQWISSGNRWWYRHSDGTYTRNGWETIAGTDYLFDGSGWMLTGWQSVNGTWYYMNSSGGKVTNQWVGNYYVDGSGAWVETRGQHHGDEGVVTKEPTCTETGVKTFTCKTCGDTYTEVIKATGHQFGDWVTTTEPTCTTKGEKARTCSTCGYVETVSIDALGHDMVNGDGSLPTCLTNGLTTKHCTRCDYHEDAVIPALGHNWKDVAEQGHWDVQTVWVAYDKCKKCGFETEDNDIMDMHCLDCDSTYTTLKKQVEKKTWVVDVPAHKECDRCHETKEN